MSKRKGEELAGPSRKKTTSQAGTSSRVTEEEDEDEMNLTQRADFDINSVWVIIVTHSRYQSTCTHKGN